MRLPRLLENYLARHAQVALSSLGRLYRAPLASMMTAAVLGIALALPTGLYVLTNNLQRLSTQWDGGANISLFLRNSIATEQAQELQRELQRWQEVDSVQLITPDQALAEFRELSGFGDVLGALQDNPLPAVIAIKPADSHADAEAAAALMDRLRALPEVDIAQLDLQWVQRLNAILDIARRGVLVISLLLALAVLLVVGNTMRPITDRMRVSREKLAFLVDATSAPIAPKVVVGLAPLWKDRRTQPSKRKVVVSRFIG